MRLQTTTLSNQDISAYLLADTFTADADRELTIFVALDAIAGGGNYSVYLTRQLAGAGAAYMLPITTFAVPAAQTAIAFQSITVEAETDDVISVYVKGLVGDTTTPDIITNWYDVAGTNAAAVRVELATELTRITGALPDAAPGSDEGLPLVFSGNPPSVMLVGARVDSQSAYFQTFTLPADVDGLDVFSVPVLAGAYPDDAFRGHILFSATTTISYLVLAYVGLTATFTIDHILVDGEEENKVMLLPFKAGIGASAADTAAAVRVELATELARIDDNITSRAEPGADGDTLETLSDQMDALAISGAGAGSSTLVYTVTDADTGLPIADCKVWATTDLPGNNIVAGGRTSLLGVVTLYLDPGTYYIWRRKSTHTFDNPDTETVV